MPKLFVFHGSVLALAFGAACFVACSSGDDAGGTEAGDAGTLSSDGGSSGSSGDVDAGPASYSVFATVVGLQGTGLVLKEKNGADVPVAPQGGANVKVTFPAKLAPGATYEVTVKTQPSAPPQTCAVTGGTGTVVAGNVESITVNCTTQYTVGGTVSGLAGQNLVLENNGAADSVTVNANGTFAFPKPLATGSPWAVTVKTNPTNKWQTCVASVGDAGAPSGTIGTANVDNVSVACTTNKYTVSVKVAGLAGSGLVFQNGAEELPVAANGTYAFATSVESGVDHDVTVKTQPSSPWQTCTVTGGKAKVAGANVTLDVACATNKYKVGGTLAGLQGNGLVLQNNAGDDLVLNAASNGAFAFATSLDSLAAYAVTIKTQPAGVAGEVCSISNGTGNVAGENVTTVGVSCATELGTLNGTQDTNVSTPYGGFHDTTTSDPVTGKVYVFPSYSGVTTVREFPTLADFKANTNVRSIALATAYEGTYHVALNGHLYYPANNSNTLVRAKVSDGTVAATTVLAGAGFHNQSCYNWGGFSDINFYLDVGNSLYVVSATPGGNMQIRSVDPATLALGAPVTFNRGKTNTGWGFVRRGRFYWGTTYSSPAFGGSFDIATGAAVAHTNSFTPVANDYVTSVSWNPTSKNLFVNTAGRTVIYPNVE